jgi:hypothetical protein
MAERPFDNLVHAPTATPGQGAENFQAPWSRRPAAYSTVEMEGGTIRPTDGADYKGIRWRGGEEDLEIGNNLLVRSVVEESTLRGCREHSVSSAQPGEQLAKRFVPAP